MTDLDAIRARDAHDAVWTTRAGASAWVAQLRVDVRVLLALLDAAQAEVDSATEDAIAHGRAMAAVERARIVEAMNRIPPGEFVRAAVLRVIDQSTDSDDQVSPEDER